MTASNEPLFCGCGRGIDRRALPTFQSAPSPGGAAALVLAGTLERFPPALLRDIQIHVDAAVRRHGVTTLWTGSFCGPVMTRWQSTYGVRWPRDEIGVRVTGRAVARMRDSGHTEEIVWSQEA